MDGVIDRLREFSSRAAGGDASVVFAAFVLVQRHVTPEEEGRTITQQASTPGGAQHKMGLGINLGGTIFGLACPR